VKHAVVWIDQKEARVFEVDADKVEQSIHHSPGPHIHRHANERDLRVRNHPDDEKRYFHEVAQALQDRGQVLLVGPAMTKLHFLRYVQQHDHALEARIVGIESADHPTDAQLVAHLRQYFHESAPR
jgi:stalled ribosome rescue protein Dom34